jgi:hypothetical protein
MKVPTKSELLAHYAEREPKEFEQYDAHYDSGVAPTGEESWRLSSAEESPPARST